MKPFPLLAALAATTWMVLAALSLAGSTVPALAPSAVPSTAGAGSDEASAPAAALPPPIDLAALPGLHLLGQAPSLLTAAAALPPPAAASEPPAALELTGVLPGPAGAGGLAILATPDGQWSYPLGAELPGGARLTAIDVTGVMLERAGLPERLDLPVASLEPASAPVVPPALLEKPTRATLPAATTPGGGGSTTAIARQRIEEARQRMEQARRQQATAPRPAPTPPPRPR